MKGIFLSKSYSYWALLFCCVFIFIFRSFHIGNNEIAWDIYGYYLPLDATFIEDDPMLNNRAWVEDKVASNNLAGTAYFVAQNETGEPMYFFLFGMSYVYAIFFFIGDFLAQMLGYAQDGLSPPYQYMLVYGCMLYTFVGLFYLRKILKEYVSEIVTSIVLIILVIGTNYSHHMILKNLETVNVLFMFAAIVVWNTIQWYKTQQLKNMIAIGVSIALMSLIKPSEVLFAMVPFIWGIGSLKDIIERIKLFWKKKHQLIITIGICLLIGAHQIWYWHAKTGLFIYDTYQNPGVGLDVFSPHIFESLFSYRKGWLLYTPIMIFSLIGFVHLFKQNRKLFFGIFIPFVVAFYIIASWTEYWYGAGFSNRPVITQYVLLSIPLAYFVKWTLSHSKGLKIGIFAIGILFVCLNQFQWWQLRNYILDPYRTTKEYYWATFLKTDASEADKKLLLVNREFTGEHNFTNRDEYKAKVLIDSLSLGNFGDSILWYEYANTYHIPFEELTKDDHFWVTYSFDYRMPEEPTSFIFCSMMDRDNGSYSPKYYHTTGSKEWQSVAFDYLTPEIRERSDKLKFFFWNQGKQAVGVKNFKVTIWEKKK